MAVSPTILQENLILTRSKVWGTDPADTKYEFEDEVCLVTSTDLLAYLNSGFQVKAW